MDILPIIAVVAIYVLLTALAGWLILFPTARLQIAGLFSSWAGVLATAAGQVSTRFLGVSGGISQGRTHTTNEMKVAGAWMRRHRLALGAAAVVLLGPPLVAMSLQRYQTPAGFQDTVVDQDIVVSSLLQGEQLVPPLPLPPEIFSTREVEEIRPALGSASRDWLALEVEFRQRLLRVFKIMEAQGYRMALIEGYRSPQRQTLLASLGTNVTNAGAYQSYHQFGRAADCAFYRDGKLVISEREAWAMRGYQLYGAAAESVGLTWGGKWKMMDLGHVELRKANLLGQK